MDLTDDQPVDVDQADDEHELADGNIPIGVSIS